MDPSWLHLLVMIGSICGIFLAIVGGVAVLAFRPVRRERKPPATDQIAKVDVDAANAWPNKRSA